MPRAALPATRPDLPQRRLEGVLKHYMQDFAVRMKQIKAALDTGVAPPAAPGIDPSRDAEASATAQARAHPTRPARAGQPCQCEATAVSARGHRATGQGDQSWRWGWRVVCAPQGSAMTLRDKELLLEELMDIVSSIDFARGGRCRALCSWSRLPW